MKVKGIIFSDDTSFDPQAIKDVTAIFPNVIIQQGEIVNWDDWENARNAREEKLDLLTKKYMCGQDDAKCFYFTNDEEALAIISQVYPEFTIIEVNHSDFPWDYDYIRDGII